MRHYYSLFAILALICGLAIGSSILLRTGPAHDATSSSDIRSLGTAVDTYFLSQNRLPTTLSQASITDPNVAKRLEDYQYAQTSQNTYQLCTTFMTARLSGSGNLPASPSSGGVNLPNPDIHGKGHQCFSYTVLPIQAPNPVGKN